MRENRDLPGSEIRGVDTRRREVEARICTWNVADHHQSVWRRGCFTRSLQAGVVPVCLNHDLTKPWGKIVEHDDNPHGLDVLVKSGNPADVPSAREALSLLEDGIYPGWSVTFERQTGGSSLLPAGQRSMYGALPAREEIRRAELIEASPVAAPSGVGTLTLAMRGRQFAPYVDPDDLAERRAMARLEGRLAGRLADLSRIEAEFERRSIEQLDRSVARSAAFRRSYYWGGIVGAPKWRVEQITNQMLRSMAEDRGGAA